MRPTRRGSAARPRPFALRLWITFVAVLVCTTTGGSALTADWGARIERYELFTRFASLFEGGSVTPHWLPDGRHFWYAKSADDGYSFIRVDAKSGSKTPFFDEPRLLGRLAEMSGTTWTALPFATFTLDENAATALFTVDDREWQLDLKSYELTEADPRPEPRSGTATSPSGRWILEVEAFDLHVVDTTTGERARLTDDGEKLFPWSLDELAWSDDGTRVAIPRYDSRSVHRMPVVKWLPARETVEWEPYAFATEPDAQVSLNIADLAHRRVLRIEPDDDTGEYQFLVGWRTGDAELLFLRFGPGMRSLRLMAADPSSGKTRTIVRDEQKTFIEGLHVTLAAGTFHYPLPDGEHFVWKSERDGWLHFYLYRYDGTLVRRLTEGSFEVGEILGVDARRERIYFVAQADPRNPYDRHLYQTSLRGGSLRQLTDTEGTHDVAICPSFDCFVDNHSSPSRAPAAELRRIDGRIIATLERADVSRLEQLEWKPPEEFVVKAADGETDLYGLLFKPHDFDSTRRYPVIEVIYAGSWSPVVPRAFGRGENATLAHALAQLNFVTFVVDNRGTPGRGKEFQDVIYGQIGRHEIPDHVATLRQLAADRPYMDLERVGIHGKSWGGYFALRAMLQAPDAYHVGIASGIVADLSTTAAFPVAPYMGLPGENAEGYARANCLTMAGELKGKLLLTIATADANTPFSQTMRMLEAFIEARKPVDLVLFPDQHHWLEGPSMTYFYDVLRNYFVEHLKPEGAIDQD